MSQHPAALTSNGGTFGNSCPPREERNPNPDPQSWIRHSRVREGSGRKLPWFADQWARALPPPLKGPSAGRGVRVRDQPAENRDRVWNSLRRCHSNVTTTTTTKRSKGEKAGTSNNTLNSASRNKEGKHPCRHTKKRRRGKRGGRRLGRGVQIQVSRISRETGAMDVVERGMPMAGNTRRRKRQ